jgi:dihydrofolate reductase
VVAVTKRRTKGMQMKIVVQEFITLDGVVQAGGGADEDREGGFEHGGWTARFDEGPGGEEIGPIIADWESRTEALLLGRKTYDIWASFWPLADATEDGFMGDLVRTYNRVPKYVASRTRPELSWVNARLLAPDLPADVADLRAQDGGEIRVWGSTQLVKTLAQHDLIDEYRLAIYPLVLGTGKKLFSDDFPMTALTLLNSTPLGSGVVVNTYRPANS